MSVIAIFLQGAPGVCQERSLTHGTPRSGKPSRLVGLGISSEKPAGLKNKEHPAPAPRWQPAPVRIPPCRLARTKRSIQRIARAENRTGQENPFRRFHAEIRQHCCPIESVCHKALLETRLKQQKWPGDAQHDYAGDPLRETMLRICWKSLFQTGQAGASRPLRPAPMRANVAPALNE
ncbi:MAG: hypothetical protein R3D65_13765 [Zhengella sp.]|uniref:hypothetical protein n=1 Tax=Zhengella sp. TaxID=2282762 RepID=UPI001E12486C|nr:hypothetical protein [Notoacmeibacter sp.]